MLRGQMQRHKLLELRLGIVRPARRAHKPRQVHQCAGPVKAPAYFPQHAPVLQLRQFEAPRFRNPRGGHPEPRGLHIVQFLLRQVLLPDANGHLPQSQGERHVDLGRRQHQAVVHKRKIHRPQVFDPELLAIAEEARMHARYRRPQLFGNRVGNDQVAFLPSSQPQGNRLPPIRDCAPPRLDSL